MNQGADENGQGLSFGASLHAENFFDGREIDGIGGESVEGIGGNGDNRAAIQPASSVADDTGVGVRCVELQNLSGQ